MEYDLIIIGAGAGGFAAAIRANELNAKTLMINDGLPLGGTCVNVGCVPSKVLLYAGELLHLARHNSIPGIELEVKSFDFQKLMQHELDLVQMMQKEKYEKVLKRLEHVTFIQGRASFVSKNEVKVDDKTLRAKKFIIATGSTASVPPIDGIKETGFITHVEALKLKALPQELVVIGAGPLGLEFAQMYARFGSKVTILEFQPSIFQPGEEEVVNRLESLLTEEGITMKTRAMVTKAYIKGKKKVVTYRIDEKEYEVSGDEILLATGKTPNTKDLDLDKAGIETDRRHAVVVNKYLTTKNDNVFAVGDVINQPSRLETTAGREGSIAAENALTGSKLKMDYDTVPYTIFTDPQLAGVGLTEQEQMNRMKTCACRSVAFKDIPKAIILNRTEGFIKITVHPKTGQILGVHILSPNAGELIAQAMLLIKNKNTIYDVIESTPVFPTLSEAIKTCALSFVKDISGLSCCV
ncbi:MAG: mercury(II) reductase [bacterium]